MLNVAVVGCGYWGPNLVRNFRADPRCRVSFVCDQDESRLDHMKKLYPEVEATQDFGALLSCSEVDAVAVATPVGTHFPLAQNALEMGKHVFIEKPMASSVAECQDLIAMADERQRTIMVGHTFIYSTPVRKLREIIDQGTIGEVLYISSRRLNLGLFQQDINVAWDLAPHDISIILHFMGEDPVSVNCQGKAHFAAGIQDVTSMTLEFPHGGYATIHSSWLDPKKIREMTIVGSSGMLVYDDTEPMEKIRIYDKRVEVPRHYDTFGEFQYSYHYGDLYSPYLVQEEPLKVETQHFIDCALEGRRPLTNGSEGLRVVQILEASSRSLENGGGRVEIDMDASLMACANGSGSVDLAVAGAPSFS